MRHRLLSTFCLIILSSVFFCAPSQNLFSKIKGVFSKSDTEQVEDVAAEELYDLTLEENLSILPLGNQAETIRKHQHGVALQIKRDHYKVETTRSGEVIIVSVPTNDLFLPSDTSLTYLGQEKLRYFFKFLEIPDYYRMLLVMHTDNTGTPRYTAALSRYRIEAIFNWIESQDGVSTDFIIPYSLGDKQQVRPNDSLENRNLNRRLEIYLIPGTAMLKQAQKGLLK